MKKITKKDLDAFYMQVGKIYLGDYDLLREGRRSGMPELQIYIDGQLVNFFSFYTSYQMKNKCILKKPTFTMINNAINNLVNEFCEIEKIRFRIFINEENKTSDNLIPEYLLVYKK